MVNSVAVLLIMLVLAVDFASAGETIVLSDNNPMAALDLNFQSFTPFLSSLSTNPS
jgi:hypothetical protein